MEKICKVKVCSTRKIDICLSKILDQILKPGVHQADGHHVLYLWIRLDKREQKRQFIFSSLSQEKDDVIR